MKRLFCSCRAAIDRLTPIRGLLLSGGLVGLSVSVLGWLIFCGNEYVWQCCLIPPLFPPRLVILLGGALWHFLYGAMFAYLLSCCCCDRNTVRKALVDLAVIFLFGGLWYPLLFAANAPFLALIALAAALAFTAFAVLMTWRPFPLLAILCALGGLRFLFYLVGTCSFLILN